MKLLIIATALLLGGQASAQYLQRQHSLQKPYFGSGLEIPFWDFGGSTVVASDYIRLTPDRQSKVGYLWNSVESQLSAWEVIIDFKVHGQGTRLFGDGWAFFYTKDRMEVGNVFGSRDYFTGLAVFFDTYSNHNGVHNHRHPYVSAMVNDGTQHYDHDADGTHTEVSGCEFFFRNLEEPTRVKISYGDSRLHVMTQIGQKEWQQCFLVEDVFLPTGYFFGVSAATGEVADNHDILSVRTSQIASAQVPKSGDIPIIDSMRHAHQVPRAPHEAPRAHVDSAHTNSSMASIFFTVLQVLVVLGFVAAIAFFIRSQMRAKAAKRFT